MAFIHLVSLLLLIIGIITLVEPCPDCLIPGYYTCYEQVTYTYAGYRDPSYTDNPDYPQYKQGDVCEDLEPISIPPNQLRNVCRFEVRRNDCDNPDAQYENYVGDDCMKTWRWRCSHTSLCPEGWDNSSDGCVEIGDSRIVCCCQADLCNGEQYLKYSIQGFTDPEMACDVENGTCAVSITTTTEPITTETTTEAIQKCFIGTECDSTDDCCPDHIEADSIGVKCKKKKKKKKKKSRSSKSNIKTKKKSFCCIKTGFLGCVLDNDCCGKKDTCSNENICVNKYRKQSYDSKDDALANAKEIDEEQNTLLKTQREFDSIVAMLTIFGVFVLIGVCIGCYLCFYGINKHSYHTQRDEICDRNPNECVEFAVTSTVE